MAGVYLPPMHLTVNGESRDVLFAPHETLLSVLRDRLELTGTKPGCERGECGACTVLLDGTLAYACLTLAVACANVSITTIEGLARPGEMHPIQRAFLERDAAQCGYCTPGQVMAAYALLNAHPAPTRDEIISGMSGNLCRCGTYPKIIAAIEDVAASGAMRAS